jgi:hypothetical protein
MNLQQVNVKSLHPNKQGFIRIYHHRNRNLLPSTLNILVAFLHGKMTLPVVGHLQIFQLTPASVILLRDLF